MIKNAVKNYNIDEFYQNYITIIHNAALDADREMSDGEKAGYYFQENGMRVHDCEVLIFEVDPDIEQILTDHQEDMIVKTLRLADAERAFEVTRKLAETEAAEAELKHENELYMLDLQRQAAEAKDLTGSC